jgi:hypothetical protein
MTLRDLLRKTLVTQSLVPAARTNGTATGSAVDLRGYDSAVVIVNFGAYTDGTHTPSAQHSMDNSTYTNCAAADLDGSFTAVSSAGGANTMQSVGYIGSQRYLKIIMTVGSATTGALSSACVIAGAPRNAPTQ